ncbi:hypothetical protein HaLaN_21766 [Haematococcus lacustris]|uniref:Uncharacterized protein n=1 Tax=Haematococcus lacustris TaxID=44745 RepID=A0A699ZSB7_HAELA|nr:hypothetical protein HaLaN_21766 [Haematococcus lacustris]
MKGRQKGWTQPERWEVGMNRKWWVPCLSHWPKQKPCCRPPSLAWPPSGPMWPTWRFESHTAAREWPGHYSGRLHE